MSPIRELFSDNKAEASAVALQPDIPSPLVPIARLREGALGAAAVLAASLVLLAWHYAWGPFRRRPSRPFTRAAHFLKVNAVALGGEGGYRAAILKLHRAFDLAAGRRVLSDDIDGFLAEHPEFAPLGNDIERLFATSRQVFFADDAAQARAFMPLSDLADLGSRLGAAERSAA
jgi:mxaA protein